MLAGDWNCMLKIHFGISSPIANVHKLSALLVSCTFGECSCTVRISPNLFRLLVRYHHTTDHGCDHLGICFSVEPLGIGITFDLICQTLSCFQLCAFEYFDTVGWSETASVKIKKDEMKNVIKIPLQQSSEFLLQHLRMAGKPGGRKTPIITSVVCLCLGLEFLCFYLNTFAWFRTLSIFFSSVDHVVLESLCSACGEEREASHCWFDRVLCHFIGLVPFLEYASWRWWSCMRWNWQFFYGLWEPLRGFSFWLPVTAYWTELIGISNVVACWSPLSWR